MRASARRLTLLFLACAAGPILLLVTAFIAYDPVQLFHPAWGRPATVHSNLRIQIAGLIRHGDFDSVILGTSILENSSADEASRLLGGSFVNLSISAGDFYERGLILGNLLERRSLRQVIWSLDFIYLNQRRGYRVFPLNTFDFLYDGNPFNDLRLYLNRYFFNCLMHWSSTEECIGRPTTLDSPNAWAGEVEHAARFGGLDKWCSAADHWQMRDVIGKLKMAVARIEAGALDYSEGGGNVTRAIAYVEDNLLTLVARHPETRFILVFPPYSRAKFAIWHQQQPGTAEAHEAVIRHVAARAAALPNLEILGFEDQDFLDDIAHYKDLDHFGPAINRMMTATIHEGRQRITTANVSRYLATAKRLALSYDLTGLTAKLVRCQTGSR